MISKATSIIIPAYNEEHVIGYLLKGLLPDFVEDGNEVIVVCNACTDNTVKVASSFMGIKVIETEKEYLFETITENTNSTVKSRNRFSRLYLPGNTPNLMINAGIHKPDGIILDLEDAVAVFFKIPPVLKNLNRHPTRVYNPHRVSFCKFNFFRIKKRNSYEFLFYSSLSNRNMQLYLQGIITPIIKYNQQIKSPTWIKIIY